MALISALTEGGKERGTSSVERAGEEDDTVMVEVLEEEQEAAREARPHGWGGVCG